MKKNKKGFFFTVISALLVGFFVLMASPPTHRAVIDYKSVEKFSLESSHDFYQSLKYEIIPSILAESAYNALNNISREYKYLPSGNEFENYFKGLYWNKTREGINEHFSNDLNVTSVLEKLEKYVSDYFPSGYKLEFGKDYDDADIKIFQNDNTGAFGVGINSTLWVSLRTRFAKWNQTLNFSVIVPIIGLEDPTYANKTDNKYHNYFNHSTLDVVRFINGTKSTEIVYLLKIYTPIQIDCSSNKSWNYTCFEDHVNRSAYMKYEFAPSFLDRMKGDLSQPTNPNCCGIESILNPKKDWGGIDMADITHFHENPTTPDGADKKMTYVDYCFFGGNCKDGSDPPNTYDSDLEYPLLNCLQGSFEYIKLDDTRVGLYNLTECIQ
ncbi:MAG TPA: hypothetical protein PLX15_04015 [Candidatus Woesearchaeota archaeon]|nr:hypothetical protein [Candidatus Woesearchaeota archaeon]